MKEESRRFFSIWNRDLYLIMVAAIFVYTNYIETDYLRGSQKLINRYVILANEPICLFLWMTYLALTIFYYCDKLKGSKRIVWCSLLILVAGFIWGGDFSLSRSSFHENHSACCVVLAIVYAVVLDIVRKRRNEK